MPRQKQFRGGHPGRRRNGLVDEAKVIAAGVLTSNGVIHIIDKVIVPS
ncbi:MAG TPA: fasciclin domain-containing protein [Acidimicrobiia bacterium]|nr:fasciclin domain-containing protein [Acidimicrobiia bacterium]